MKEDSNLVVRCKIRNMEITVFSRNSQGDYTSQEKTIVQETL